MQEVVVELLRQQNLDADLLLAQEAEDSQPWWASLLPPWRKPLVVLWLAVVLVTGSLLALSNWRVQGAPLLPQSTGAPGQRVRSRRALPQGLPGRLPPLRPAAAPAPAPAASPSAAAVPPAAAKRPAASELVVSSQSISGPPMLSDSTPSSARSTSPPPPPQGSDESPEEPPSETLPLLLPLDVQTLLSGRLWHDASLELLRLVSEPDSSLVKIEEQARTLLSNHLKTLRMGYLCHVDPMSLPEEERKFIATLLSEDINVTAEMI